MPTSPLAASDSKFAILDSARHAAVASPQTGPQPQLVVTANDPQLPVVLPPKKSLFQRFAESDHGVAAKLCCNVAGSILGYLVPAAVMVGAGIAIKTMPGGGGDLGDTAIVLGLGAGIAQACYQGGMGDNIELYRKAGHPYPRLASFRDVGVFFTGLGSGTALALAHLVDPATGLIGGAIMGALGGSYLIATAKVRAKRLGI